MKQRTTILLVVALAAEAIILLLTQQDLPASDPLWYASLAHDIDADASQVFSGHDAHPFVMRIGLTVPLALLYRSFDVTPLATALPVLLASLGILAVVYAAASSPRAKYLAVLFVLTNTPLIAHGTTVGVDLPCGALLGASVLCLARRDRGERWLAAAMVAWFVAFLVKETALWLFPVWGYALVVDLRVHGARRIARAYGIAAGVGAVLAVIYLAWCASVWGTPWARFQAINDLTGEHTWSMARQSTAAWVKRLTWRPPLLFLQMFKVALVAVVLAPWFLRGRERIWLVATATLALFFWFGSSSLSSYSPLPIMQRMALPLLPFVMVVASLTTARILERLGPRARITAVIALVIAVAFPSTQAVYRLMSYGRPETEIFAQLREEISRSQKEFVLVCGDARCPEIASYHFGFALPPNVRVLVPTDLATVSLPPGAIYRVLISRPRSASYQRNGPSNDFSPGLDALKLPLLASVQDVELYDAGDGTVLRPR